MSPPPLLAGFDAGQTHTTCRLARLDGSGKQGPTLAEGEGPGVTHLAAPGGPLRFQEALRQSLAAAMAQLLDPAEPLAAAAIGASGIETGSGVQRLGETLALPALDVTPGQVLVCGDERTALAGAFPEGAGILVISGTGCIAVGRNPQGQHHRCGGWGWLLDGAGSAMDLGHDALALSVQMADGRLADTPLRQALWTALGASSAQEVKALVVAAEFGAAGFARLAPVVDQLAAAGDPQAQAVVRRSAEALVNLVGGVAQALELTAPPVCGVGGAIQHLKTLREQFRSGLGERLPGSRWVAPHGDALAGALGLAAGLVAPGAGAGATT